MQHILAVVIGIGLVDSVNPVTIAPAFYLAAAPGGAKSLTGFIGGVFLTNLAAGLVIALGPGQFLMSFVPHPGAHAKHLLELSVGSALVVLAAALWFQRHRVAHHVRAGGAQLDRSAFVVGAGLVLVELPTAIPYFAAIAAVVGSGEHWTTQMLLLTVFNACFVLPLLAILTFRVFAGKRSRAWLVRARGGVDDFLARLAPILVLAIGLGLVALGLVGLLGD
ncbi:MAG TPA: GAP family protein [Gaiellaceae bacterium]|jgi:cytochrome c biogenesis protein CcdA|nr:GAP family protein [Gaiellaceae bacterium]